MRHGKVSRVRIVAAAAFLSLGLLPDSLHSQWIPAFERPRAQVGARYDGLWVRSLSALGDLERAVAQQWASVQLGGTVGPREGRPVIRLRLDAMPYIGQGWAVPDPGADLDQDGLRGTAALTVAPTSDVSVTGEGGVTQSFVPDMSGGYQQRDETRWSARYRDQNPLLPMTVSYEDRDESSVLFSGLSQRALNLDRRLKEFRYQATNWKTRLLFIQRDVASAADGRHEAYLQRNADATNTQRWGKGSLMRNGLGYFRRTGERASESFRYGTILHLQQTRRFSTELEWQDQRRWQPEGDGGNDRLRVRLEHAWEPVTARVEVRRQTNRFGPFSARDVRVAPQIQVDLGFGRGVYLSGYVEAGHTWNEQGSSVPSFLYVLGERQVFGTDGRIQLDNAFVDPASVVLQSPDGAIRYEPGFDYQVQAETPFWVAVTLPGGRIEDGTEVEVDYRYQASPAFSARTLDLRTSMTLRLGGLSLIYGRIARNDLDDLGSVAAAGPWLEDADQEQLGLRYTRGSPRLQLTGYGALERYRATGVSVRRKVGTLTVRSRLSRQWTASTRLRAIHSTGRTDPFTNWDAEVRLIWSPLPALTSEVFASHYTWDGPEGEERFTGVGSALSVEIGRTRASLLVDTVRRELALSRQDYRVSIRVQQGF